MLPSDPDNQCFLFGWLLFFLMFLTISERLERSWFGMSFLHHLFCAMLTFFLKYVRMNTKNVPVILSVSWHVVGRGLVVKCLNSEQPLKESFEFTCMHSTCFVVSLHFGGVDRPFVCNTACACGSEYI